MTRVKRFLEEVDKNWKPLGKEPIKLQLLGSAALMLQSDYERGTKDGDILESHALEGDVASQIKALAGKKTELHKRTGVYLDIVLRGLLFIPQKPIFHPVKDLSLKNFSAEAMDLHDVIISKLQPFRPRDLDDIREMAERDLIDHGKLEERFRLAAFNFELDSRADDLPDYLKKLNQVERDILDVEQTQMDFE